MLFRSDKHLGGNASLNYIHLAYQNNAGTQGVLDREVCFVLSVLREGENFRELYNSWTVPYVGLASVYELHL